MPDPPHRPKSRDPAESQTPEGVSQIISYSLQKRNADIFYIKRGVKRTQKWRIDVKSCFIMLPLKAKIPVTLTLQGFEMAAEQGFEP